MEVCLSQGSFSPRDFLLAVLHSLLQASGKKNGFGARFNIRGELFYLMHRQSTCERHESCSWCGVDGKMSTELNEDEIMLLE